MFKYLVLLKQTWQNMLTYRVSFVMWRVRQFLSSLMALTVWTVIYSGQNQAFGYQHDQMMTYVFLATVLFNSMMTSSLHNLADRIYSGQISFELLKPVNLFVYLGIENIADKLMNIGFVIFESMILYLIFRPNLILPTVELMPVFLIWVLLGTLMYFLVILLFGDVGFWSPDAWGPTFLFFMFLDFTAGKLYPLDILPQVVQKVVSFTPFPYLTYYQSQLFLNRIDSEQVWPITLGMLGWIGGLALLHRLVWRKGLKDYTSMGQ